MAVNVGEVFARGGKGLIDLLEFCVISVRMDPVFVFLAGEFRARPTAQGAVALYELFCARDAPARLSALRALPPYDLVVRLLAVGVIAQNPRQYGVEADPVFC